MHAAGIVEAAGDDPGAKDRVALGERAGRRAVAKDFVPPFPLVEARCADVKDLVPREVRVEGQAEQSRFAHRSDTGDLCRCDPLGHRGSALEDGDRPGPLGDEHAPVRCDRDLPRNDEP